MTHSYKALSKGNYFFKMKWLFLVVIHLIDFIQQRSLHAYYEYLTAGNLRNHCFPNMIDTHLAG